MPSVGASVIKVGPRGATGATGAQGSAMDEPFNTGVFGRINNSWGLSGRALPLAGSYVNAGSTSNHNLTGGLRFTNQIAGSGVDLSKHLDFGWGTSQYGFCITGSTLNCVAYQRHQFYNNQGYAGEIRAREYWFSTNGYRWNFNTSNGNLLYLDSGGNALYGWYDGRLVAWTHAYMSSGGGENIISVNGRGNYYYNVGSNGFNFNWDGTVYGRVDNAVQFAFVNGCDERLKQDIAPSTFDCLAAIRKMRFYQFRWKDYTNPRRPKPAKDDAPTISIGFVAQRLYEDFPEAVVRKSKHVDKGALAMWSGDVNTILATLCGALQQLDAEVKALGEV